MRLVADRPLGLFLSGGIDSGTIACRLAVTGHRDLRSFSAAFPGSALDECAEAQATARCARAAQRAHRGADLDRRRLRARSSPRSTSPSPIRRRFPTWYLAQRAPRSKSRSCWAATAATSSSPATSASRSTCATAGAAALRLPLPPLPDVQPQGLAQGRRRAGARLGGGVCAALLGPHAQPARLPAARRTAVARALLARTRRRRAGCRDAAGPLAALGFRELPARVRAAQGRLVHHGAWPRIARAAARPSVRGSRVCASRRRSASRGRPSASSARWRPSSRGSVRLPARSAASIRRSTDGCKGDLASRLPDAAGVAAGADRWPDRCHAPGGDVRRVCAQVPRWRSRCSRS